MALLAKLGWRILISGDEPWCQVLREKYEVIEGRSLPFKHRRRETQIWKGVIWASTWLREGIRWKVINGRKACFWTDKWLEEMRLKEHSLREVEGEELERIVGEYWLEGQGWNWGQLSSSLTTTALLQFAWISVNPHDIEDDQFGWLDPRNVVFSI